MSGDGTMSDAPAMAERIEAHVDEFQIMCLWQDSTCVLCGCELLAHRQFKSGPGSDTAWSVRTLPGRTWVCMDCFDDLPGGGWNDE